MRFPACPLPVAVTFAAPLLCFAQHSQAPPPGTGPAAAPANLALGRVPEGSSDSYGASFAGATDGSTDQWWRAAVDDYPSYLLLDFGSPVIVDSMNITGGDPSFQTLKIYVSGDGIAWEMVRQDETSELCAAGATSEHAGWPQPARYLAIQMEDRCSGAHVGRFTVAEWGVYGSYDAGMVQKYARTWPHCENFGMCFAHTDLREAQAKCLAEPACDGFSFSAGSLNGGYGAGCYKTTCQDDGSQGFGRGSHGYWAKQRPSVRWEGNVPYRPSTWPWGRGWPWGARSPEAAE